MVGAKKIVVVIAAVAIVAAGVYLGLPKIEYRLGHTAPGLDSGLSTTAEFSFSGTELNEETKTEIVSKVLADITPYKGVRYDKVNITAMKNGEDHDLKVICFSDACEYPDVYDFTYYSARKQLVQNRYALEAIPPSERAKAISVALQNKEAVNLLKENSLESVTPTVRRVLPETAEKFYLPKTLLSVSWTRFGANPVVVSVLVDPDEEKAVEVWSNLGVENKEGEKK
ncbi:MAG: hypothetical protein OCU20_09370 [Methanophagales archaeon]|nr:hypothetical protein [Methanophagales archaeon]MCW3138480.1 hypothetical protein [Methanophagales archaeon]MCW3139108.1 hypothetical protein [Methanophagales archaeon]MCW7069080.1 hypothetical protein [Methanophagales archaeon]MCW7074063.1 hypothetical protein [Methanophagales archaeon]